MIDGRKLAIAFGIVATIAPAGWGVYRGYLLAIGLPQQITDAEAKMAASAEPVLTELAAKDWDPAAVTRFVSPAWIEASKNGQLATALSLYKPLGAVKQLHGISGFNENGTNGAWRATAQEKADFEKMSALVTFSLSWAGDKWLVDGLSVTPTTK